MRVSCNSFSSKFRPLLFIKDLPNRGMVLVLFLEILSLGVDVFLRRLEALVAHNLLQDWWGPVTTDEHCGKGVPEDVRMTIRDPGFLGKPP